MKGISGFYYVHVAGSGIYECKAKGVFRKNHTKPLVGDDVDVEVLDEDKKIGNIISILPRKTSLYRPAVANVDQALVIFALKNPEPNFNLLDRFLLQMAMQKVPVVICFNKTDLMQGKSNQTEKSLQNLKTTEKSQPVEMRQKDDTVQTKKNSQTDGNLSDNEDLQAEAVSQIYKNSGCRLLFLSAATMPIKETLLPILLGKTTVVAGPSGVGKSTTVNALQTTLHMETGEVSKKIGRGKHTTRHAELIAIEKDTYICDTPGFSALDVPEMEKEDLQSFYPEFEPYAPYCRFRGCVHVNEPDCGVREAVKKGQISEMRYRNYCRLYEELKNRKPSY